MTDIKTGRDPFWLAIGLNAIFVVVFSVVTILAVDHSKQKRERGVTTQVISHIAKPDPARTMISV